MPPFRTLRRNPLKQTAIADQACNDLLTLTQCFSVTGHFYAQALLAMRRSFRYYSESLWQKQFKPIKKT